MKPINSRYPLVSWHDRPRLLTTTMRTTIKPAPAIAKKDIASDIWWRRWLRHSASSKVVTPTPLVDDSAYISKAIYVRPFFWSHPGQMERDTSVGIFDILIFFDSQLVSDRVSPPMAWLNTFEKAMIHGSLQLRKNPPRKLEFVSLLLSSVLTIDHIDPASTGILLSKGNYS